MIGALAQEWMRLRTVRSTWWITGLALAIPVLLTSGGLWLLHLSSAQTAEEFGGAPAPDQTAYLFVLTFWTFPVSLLLALLAVLSFGHEYRYGTMRATLTTVPNRASVAAAKVIVTAGWSAAVLVTALLLSWLLLTLFGSFTDAGLTRGEGPRVALGMVLYAVLLSLLGLGIGWLLRSQVLAVVVLLIWALAAEGAVTTFVLLVQPLQRFAWLTNYLPLSAGRRMYANTGSPEFVDPTFGDPLSPLGGGLIMAGVVAAILALAYALFEKRDA